MPATVVQIRTLQAKADDLSAAAERANDACFMADVTRSVFAHKAHNRALAAVAAAKAARAEVEAATAGMGFVEACFACYTDQQLAAQGYNVAKMRASLGDQRVAA